MRSSNKVQCFHLAAKVAVCELPDSDLMVASEAQVAAEFGVLETAPFVAQAAGLSAAVTL